jgi:hypothetical protein
MTAACSKITVAKSPLHSSALKKANRRRKLVQRPVYNISNDVGDVNGTWNLFL